MDELPQTEKPLEYEETPIIAPVVESPVSPEVTTEPQPAPAPVTAPPKGDSFLGNVILFIILFGAGVGLSLFLRQYLPSGASAPAALKPTPTLAPTPGPLVSTDLYATWKTYQVVSGVTKQPLAISFKLPGDVAAPICDGASCASQGTYLPGGTRFTVAARGSGQLLADFRGKIVSDLAGQQFVVRDASVSGKPAVEFSGLFTGTTNGGYSFSQMRGFMIEVSGTLSLEINHFTPSGVNADFTSDDTLFNKIIQSLEFPLGPIPNASATPTIVASPTQSATPPAVNPYSY